MNNKIEDFLKSLIGKKCWGYSAGYPTASEVFLYLGEKVLLDAPLHSETWKYGLDKYDGEFSIGIFSEWRLQTKKRPVTGSCEPNNADGPMLRGLERVINKTIKDILITDECGDLFISFGNVFLKVFCNFTGNADKEYCFQDDINWGIWKDSGLVLSVEQGCKIVFDNKKASKRKELTVKPEKV